MNVRHETKQNLIICMICVLLGYAFCNSPKYTPGMFWLRQNITVMDLFIYTFEHC